MICVYGSFVLSDRRLLKLIGFGLAFAVFIDATVVRLVLVPATMALLGDRNWWFPKMLEWLPRIHIEGSAAPALAAVTPERQGQPRLGDYPPWHTPYTPRATASCRLARALRIDFTSGPLSITPHSYASSTK